MPVDSPSFGRGRQIPLRAHQEQLFEKELHPLVTGSSNFDLREIFQRMATNDIQTFLTSIVEEEDESKASERRSKAKAHSPKQSKDGEEAEDEDGDEEESEAPKSHSKTDFKEDEDARVLLDTVQILDILTQDPTGEGEKILAWFPFPLSVRQKAFIIFIKAAEVNGDDPPSIQKLKDRYQKLKDHPHPHDEGLFCAPFVSRLIKERGTAIAFLEKEKDKLVDHCLRDAKLASIIFGRIWVELIRLYLTETDDDCPPLTYFSTPQLPSLHKAQQLLNGLTTFGLNTTERDRLYCFLAILRSRTASSTERREILYDCLGDILFRWLKFPRDLRQFHDRTKTASTLEKIHFGNAIETLCASATRTRDDSCGIGNLLLELALCSEGDDFDFFWESAISIFVGSDFGLLHYGIALKRRALEYETELEQQSILTQLAIAKTHPTTCNYGSMTRRRGREPWFQKALYYALTIQANHIAQTANTDEEERKMVEAYPSPFREAMMRYLNWDQRKEGETNENELQSYVCEVEVKLGEL